MTSIATILASHQVKLRSVVIIAAALLIASVFMLPSITDAQNGSGTINGSCWSPDYHGPYPCEIAPGQCMDTHGTVACPTPDPCDPSGWTGSGFTPSPPPPGWVPPDYCSPPPTDVCPVSPGTQTDPNQCSCQDHGYQAGTLGNCYNDQCPSMAGIQASASECPVVPQCSTQGQSCTSGANSCGMTSSGIVDANCQCSATTPANPSFYGQACTSGANSCGMTNSGTISCTGQCSASAAPSNSLCPAQSTPCTSAPNVCGITSGGYSVNGGVCSATTPPAIDQCPNDAGVQCSSSQCTVTPPTCTPSGACAANTCSTSTCTDSCGNTYQGTNTAGVCAPTCNTADPYCTGEYYYPDISAGMGALSGAAVGTPTNLRGYAIADDWLQVRTVSWQNIFQIRTSGSGMAPENAVVSGTPTVVPYSYSYFGDNSFQQITGAYTFQQQGYYQVRACGDMNTSFQGSVYESNEDNNCSAWQTVYATNNAASCPNPITVTGNASSPYGVWGSSPYTFDSDLGKAAIHQGLIQSGQTAVLSKSANTIYQYFSGSTRNGITTDSWWEEYYGVTLTLCSILNTTGPNLGAGAVSPNTANANVPVTLTAPVSNSGAASTGASFSNLFQRATDSSGSNATDIGSPTMSALGVGSTGTASLSYTFPSSGTYYVRVCADKSSGGSSGTITETNENDNCGSWTAITVGNASVSCSLSANPSIITSGNSSTLTWTSSNASSCTGSGFSTSGATSGARSVSPSTTSSYGLSCTNSSGTATCNATPAMVTVTGGSCSGSATVTITANPARVQPGQTSTINWTATNVPGTNGACTISGPGISQTSTADSTSSCALSGSATTPTLNTQSTYTISCPGGTTKSVIVNVLPKFEEF